VSTITVTPHLGPFRFRARAFVAVAFVVALALLATFGLRLADPASGSEAGYNAGAATANLTAAIDHATAGMPGAGTTTAVRPGPAPNTAYATQQVGATSFRQLVAIGDRSAPTEYSFDVGVPAGGSIQLTDGGRGASSVLDANRQTVATIGAPWAKDALGHSVATYYSTNGTTLIQTVEHRAKGVVGIVVADPIMILWAIYGALFLLKCAVNGGNEAKGLRGQKWYIIAWRVSWVCVT